MTPGPPHEEESDRITGRAITDATTAWEQLLASQQEVTRALAAARRRSRARGLPLKLRDALQVFIRATARFSAATGVLVERWTAVDLPRLYRLGAEEALRRAVLTAGQARPVFAWHPGHQRTLRTLTDAARAVLVRRFSDVVRRCQAFSRAAAAAARHSSPPDAALADQHRLGDVPYASTLRHPAASWARAAFTAQSVTAANAGALTATASDLGARWVHVTDGPECGWTSHRDHDRAHATLRSATQAAAHPIAHPGCRRTFTPRPDLNDRLDIEEGQSL